ncbi:hypothetical protein DSUL_140112 [Desulfovibrionales bacterium]
MLLSLSVSIILNVTLVILLPAEIILAVIIFIINGTI